MTIVGRPLVSVFFLNESLRVLREGLTVALRLTVSLPTGGQIGYREFG